jgi:glutamate 5-kinase
VKAPGTLAEARRVVVKIGSGVLREGRRFDRVTFASLVRDLVALREANVEVVVVSSGAVALGMERLGVAERPVEMARLQATAAIGQGRLMRLWEDELGGYGILAAQVLLTHDDLRTRNRYLAARHTLRAALELGAVPVINENDTVAIEEIKMGDNDMLSAQVVNLVEAELLIILSDVDGLYDRPPKEPGAVRLERVARIDAELARMAGGSGSVFGSGGMRTKVEAVRQINHRGLPAVIAGGKTPRVLRRLLAGEALGTWFEPEPNPMPSRKQWIAYALRPVGTLHIDAGAVRALREKGSSLLPVGVVSVDGDFGVGDPVRVVGPDGAEVARGLVAHDAGAIRGAMGRSKQALDASAPEVIHRDDLVTLPAASAP